MKLTSEQRTLALCHAFGWQDGTIHQLACETGCSMSELLYTEEIDSNSSNGAGWFAVRTCDRAFNLKVNYPKHKGDVQFWLGVAAGQHVHDAVQGGQSGIINLEAGTAEIGQ